MQKYAAQWFLTLSEEIPPKVLIVEDDEGLNRLVVKRLNRDGYETLSAFSGKEALALLLKDKNVILLLDFKLPDMTAMEVLEKLAEYKWEGPFLIMTGHGDERLAVELMKQGAIDYIVKDTNFIDVISQKIKRAYDIIEQQKALLLG